jgi:hypothetical protein
MNVRPAAPIRCTAAAISMSIFGADLVRLAALDWARRCLDSARGSRDVG